MIYTGLPSFFGLGLEDGHVPTFWLLLWVSFTQAILRDRVNYRITGSSVGELLHGRLRVTCAGYV